MVLGVDMNMNSNRILNNNKRTNNFNIDYIINDIYISK
jgi:hypothetical protein